MSEFNLDFIIRGGKSTYPFKQRSENFGCEKLGNCSRERFNCKYHPADPSRANPDNVINFSACAYISPYNSFTINELYGRSFKAGDSKICMRLNDLSAIYMYICILLSNIYFSLSLSSGLRLRIRDRFLHIQNLFPGDLGSIRAC